MVAEKDTPEEQLLRMIEGSKAKRPAGASASRRRSWRDFLPGGVSQKQTGGSGSVAIQADGYLVRLNWANRVVWLLLVALATYAVVDVVIGRKQLAAKLAAVESSLAQTQVVAEVAPAEVPSRLQPLGVYIERLRQRNPLTGARMESEEKQVLVEEEERIDVHAMAEGLVVVGLDRGDEPEALVEDTKQQRTYFLKAGDKIREFTIKEINTRGLVLTYEGEDLLLE
jgi:hypothetical protein